MPDVLRDAQLVLVTGASGWLGTSLLRALRGDGAITALRAPDGLRIRCFVPPGEDAPSCASARAEIVLGDITSRDDVARFCEGAEAAVIFHAAGVIHPRRVRDLYRINYDGTVNLIEAARRAGARRLVGVSSNAPFGFNRSPEDTFDERSPYRPHLNYGRSKWMMERALLAANGSGLETVVIRPPWYYGPHQPARQTTFYRMVKAGRVPLFGDGGNRRSMAYVGNVVAGLLLAASVPAAAGQAYWIADARAYAMREIVDTIERVLVEFGHRVRGRQPVVPRIVSGAARAADRAMQSAGIYNSKIHVLGELSETIACSIEKARRELGYEPEVGLEEGVRRSVRWCADHGVAI
jgi:nucleoside-diphosphate-sugar epimerase